MLHHHHSTPQSKNQETFNYHLNTFHKEFLFGYYMSILCQAKLGQFQARHKKTCNFDYKLACEKFYSANVLMTFAFNMDVRPGEVFLF